jgi:F0F1-type ATP synthase assembly protein I
MTTELLDNTPETKKQRNLRYLQKLALGFGILETGVFGALFTGFFASSKYINYPEILAGLTEQGADIVFPAAVAFMVIDFGIKLYALSQTSEAKIESELKASFHIQDLTREGEKLIKDMAELEYCNQKVAAAISAIKAFGVGPLIVAQVTAAKLGMTTGVLHSIGAMTPWGFAGILAVMTLDNLRQGLDYHNKIKEIDINIQNKLEGHEVDALKILKTHYTQKRNQAIIHTAITGILCGLMTGLMVYGVTNPIAMIALGLVGMMLSGYMKYQLGKALIAKPSSAGMFSGSSSNVPPNATGLSAAGMSLAVAVA